MRFLYFECLKRGIVIRSDAAIIIILYRIIVHRNRTDYLAGGGATAQRGDGGGLLRRTASFERGFCSVQSAFNGCAKKSLQCRL